MSGPERRAATASLILAVAVALGGCATHQVSAAHPSSAATPRAPARPTPSPLPPLPTGPSDAAAPAPAAGSSTAVPVSLSLPAISVTTALQPLGLLADGALQSPSQWQVAGWFAGGVRPGDPGPAVIAGHVDSVNGPAIFYQLRRLVPGDLARVRRADGSTVTFVVDTVQEFAKNAFPTDAVYGPTALPVLRLVTCTGDFDYQARSYLDNLVVSAHLESP